MTHWDFRTHLQAQQEGKSLPLPILAAEWDQLKKKACSHSRQFEFVLSDTEVQMTFLFWHKDFGSLESAGAK